MQFSRRVPGQNETMVKIQFEWFNDCFNIAIDLMDEFDLLQIIGVIIKLLHKMAIAWILHLNNQQVREIDAKHCQIDDIHILRRGKRYYITKWTNKEKKKQ